MLQAHFDAAFDSLDQYWFDSPDPELDSRSGPAELLSADERRRLRRKISNRESARRCRVRKQRRLEELRSESARLSSLNQDLARRVVAASHRCQLFRNENLRLRAESAALGRRLSELRRFILLLRQLSPAAHGGFLTGLPFEDASALLTT
ncbi:basic leucine zipper 4-like [Curcuma longa]|uniref:basic leucine zipper 4-like n=1 Tax=Curcuma longa TaxID=136217 RepID=UPI003D9E957F